MKPTSPGAGHPSQKLKGSEGIVHFLSLAAPKIPHENHTWVPLADGLGISVETANCRQSRHSFEELKSWHFVELAETSGLEATHSPNFGKLRTRSIISKPKSINLTVAADDYPGHVRIFGRELRPLIAIWTPPGLDGNSVPDATIPAN
jgi:hypothetical protein